MAEHEVVLRGFVARRFAPGVRDDIVQETLLVAWNRFEHLDTQVDPALHRAWLCRVARNVARDLERGERRRRHRQTRAAADPTERAAAATVADPANVIGGHDATEQFLARLAPDDRELLVAAAWDGFSARELGELLGCTEATARQRQSRLLRRLRAELGTPEGGLP